MFKLKRYNLFISSLQALLVNFACESASTSVFSSADSSSSIRSQAKGLLGDSLVGHTKDMSIPFLVRYLDLFNYALLAFSASLLFLTYMVIPFKFHDFS